MYLFIYSFVQDEKKSVKKKRKRKKSSARRASDSSEEESDAESKVSHSVTDGSFLFWLMKSECGAENVRSHGRNLPKCFSSQEEKEENQRRRRQREGCSYSLSHLSAFQITLNMLFITLTCHLKVTTHTKKVK